MVASVFVCRSYCRRMFFPSLSVASLSCFKWKETLAIVCQFNLLFPNALVYVVCWPMFSIFNSFVTARNHWRIEALHSAIISEFIDDDNDSIENNTVVVICQINLKLARIVSVTKCSEWSDQRSNFFDLFDIYSREIFHANWRFFDWPIATLA